MWSFWRGVVYVVDGWGLVGGVCLDEVWGSKSGFGRKECCFECYVD